MSKLAVHVPHVNQQQDEDALDDSVPVMVVVIEPQQCWIGPEIDYCVGLTLLAVMSEDPGQWQDVQKLWARYRTDSVDRHLPVQQWHRCDEAAAWQAIGNHGNWLVFDLRDKRVITGTENQDFDMDMTMGLRKDEQGKHIDLLPIHLPPWWELDQKRDAVDVLHRREQGFRVPRADRQLLYGRPLIEDLASRIIGMALAGRTANLKMPQPVADADDLAVGGDCEREDLRTWYALTVEVHRAWLMTPRDDLSGGRPRDLLHGAHDWSDAVTAGQRRRFDSGAELVALPEDVLGFADAPLGSQELIVYFDLCRELIQAGWQWIAAQAEAAQDKRDELIVHLQQIRDEWLARPYEDDAPPQFIIECSRRRVPRGAGVAIQGMDQCEPPQHLGAGDCDCPVCNLLDSGMFGTSFTWLDGHHLELDDEFAFSMFEKHEDWEEQSQVWREMSDECDEDKECDECDDCDEDDEGGEARESTAEHPMRTSQQLDEFASAWSNPMSDEPLPGDRHGYMRLAFRLSEVIAELESIGAPHTHIARLNRAFRGFFESDLTSSVAARGSFKESLEQVADHYPHLLPKLCDLQSQVDELARRKSRC